jgi:hypothetical protein
MQRASIRALARRLGQRLGLAREELRGRRGEGQECLSRVVHPSPLRLWGRICDTEGRTLAATQQTVAVLLRARGGHDPRWD